MLECKNASEPMDLKLAAILFLKKIWILPIVLLIGALFGGICYFIPNILFAEEPIYQTRSEFYVDYVANDKGEYTYYAFNAEGWEMLAKTDAVVDPVLEELSFSIEKEELRNAISLNYSTDHRMIQLIISYKDATQAVEIANKMEKSLVSLATEMRECENIRIFTSAETAVLVLVDTHVARAAILGAIVASLLYLFAFSLCLILDEAIYVPITFEKRYQIPMLGIFTAIGENYQEELLRNYAIAYSEKATPFMCPIQKDAGIEALSKLIEAPMLEEIKENGNGNPVILAIPAGKQNGKIIEKRISDLNKTGYRVEAAILMNPNKKIIKQYYFGVRRTKK